MALSAKVGYFNTGTGNVGTTVSVSDVGFQPKAIIFFHSGPVSTTDAVAGADDNLGIGFAVSATDRRAVNAYDQDAAVTSNSVLGHTSAACVNHCDANGYDGQLDLQSMDAGGFTLDVTDKMPVSMRVMYLALGGDDLTNAATGQFQCPGSTGNQSYTSLAFQPDVVLFAYVNNAIAPQSEGTKRSIGLGAAVSSTQRAVISGSSEDATADMVVKGYGYGAECIAIQQQSDGAPIARADFVQMLSNGFQINWLEVTANKYVHFLALKGGQYAVGDSLTQTDTVTDIAITGLGFQPVAVFIASHSNTESTQDTAQADSRMSLGAATSTTERGAVATYSQDAAATSVVATAVEHDELYANISSSDTIQGLMDLKSMDSGGFTCIMDDADPQQNFFWYLAAGSAAGGGGGNPWHAYAQQ